MHIYFDSGIKNPGVTIKIKCYTTIFNSFQTVRLSETTEI